MKTIKPLPLPGFDTQMEQPWEQPHAKIARTAAADSFVLLKNEAETLPLAAGCRVALYGVGAVYPIKGGTGSGDVNERYVVSIARGLRDAGFILTSEAWLADADKAYSTARLAWRDEILDKAEGDLRGFFGYYATTPFEMPAGEPIPAADPETDTAIYVISRIAGEGADRRPVKGDYYLSDAEEKAIDDLCSVYERIVLLLNVGGVIDLSILDRQPKIRSVLLIGQPGMECGHAVADVLSGAVAPSGKLTNTWALSYDDYPNAKTFSHMNGDVKHEVYTEDIYVGYRYFDTFGVPVRYGFGDGIGYTRFELDNVWTECGTDGTVSLHYSVKNTGKQAGREVVQLYLVLPDTASGREIRCLAAYEKTPLLSGGASYTGVLTFNGEAAATYDETRSAWVVPQGRYGLCLGTSLAGSCIAGWLELPEEQVLSVCRSICPPQQKIDRLHPDHAKRQAQMDSIPVSGHSKSIVWDFSSAETVSYKYGNPDESGDEAAQIAARLTVDQLIELSAGDPGKGQGSELGSAGASVPGSAAETSSCALNDGVANIVLADGPAGLRLNQTCYIRDGHPIKQGFMQSIEHGIFNKEPEPEGDRRWQYCTAIPVGSLLAQSWDEKVLMDCGDAVGDEMERFNVTLWLAPGMNIHRNPLCGRNFEYYSEDPLLAGKMAAAMTKGVQRHKGCGTTIKHFACNNQEDNRMGSDSILSERALREIYLRGFGIAIRESQPMSIMTSYNLINGVHAANNYDLCMAVARNEFGFKGVIMTDWTTTEKGPDCTAAGCIRAGNDLTMPGKDTDFESIREGLASGLITEQELRRCVTRTIRTVLASRRYMD
ncbi:MAG: glycoside hydrolase family 3 C-terminal domain-containing protein [Clostridia bacterium]|nr:glycoside hydrolase family 3 C-terminal domain-containing protein [Clostridia bacterium]